MSGVIILNGELHFTLRYTLEWATLSHGAPGARAHIKKMRKKAKHENDRKALAEMDKIPVIIATTREEIYDRSYALIREVGQAIRGEIVRMKYPEAEKPLLEGAFQSGFFNTGCGRESTRDRYIGIARLCYACGELVANMTKSIFPENNEEPSPDVGEIFAAFWRGVREDAV